MPTHVALLRGINLGGRNRVAMSDLRELCASLGHTEVSTYIQSGNVVFTTDDTDTVALAAALERAFPAALGVRASVVVLSRAELASVVTANPYADEPDPRRVHAVFGREGGAADVAAVEAAQQRAREAGSRDAAGFVGRTLYLHTPDGFGRSDLAARLMRSGEGTARNWATVTRLLALLDT